MRVLYHPKVKTDDIPRLGTDVASRIEGAITERLAVEPEKYGLPLRKGLSGYRKLRIGDYRVIYYVKGSEIRILIIGHRSDVYRRIKKRI